MIYLITPTGGRPEGLALLGEYLNAQSYSGPAQWIVVDDVSPATRVPTVKYQTQVIRPAWRWKDKSTQAQSILEALRYVPADAPVFIMEDDDCYLPGYIDAMLQGLKGADMVGESTARYYNVRTRRYRQMNTRAHSSLASTAVSGKGPLVDACKRAPRFIDMHLWKTFRGRKAWLDTHNVVGIKGLPGRAGIGVGHRSKFGTPDKGDTLREWAGDYADNYQEFRA